MSTQLANQKEEKLPGLPRSRPSGARAVRRGFLLISALYFVIPLAWLFIAASKSSSALAAEPIWSLHGFQLFENLASLFTYDHGIYLRWALNSVLYAGAGALVGTLICALGGHYFSLWSFRGKELLFNIVLGGVLVPSTALALPLFLLFSQAGLTNTFWSIFLPSLVNPFAFYLSRLTADASVPVEVVESARVDGAGEFKVFFSIAVRMMIPGLVTVFLTQFVSIWNNFLLPVVMLHDQTLLPVTMGLFTWNGQLSLAPELQTLVLVGSMV